MCSVYESSHLLHMEGSYPRVISSGYKQRFDVFPMAIQTVKKTQSCNQCEQSFSYHSKHVKHQINTQLGEGSPYEYTLVLEIFQSEL